MSKRKTVRPGVREISPVSIVLSLRWKTLQEEVCLSLDSRVTEWKKRSDGDRSGDDSVDQTCVACEKVKDQDVNEAHGKSEGVYSKGVVPHVEKNGL